MCVCVLVPIPQAVAEIQSVEARFGIDELPGASAEAESLLKQCRATYVTGLCLEAFRKPTARDDLRTRLMKALTIWPAPLFEESTLHKTLLSRIDLAKRYQIAV